MLEINSIHLGECLEIMEQIEDKSIDMVLCDLPYEVTSKCEWDVIIPFDKLWEQYERIIKTNGAIVLTGTQPFTSKLIMSNLKLFKYCWVYEKTSATNYLNAKKQPMKYHEDVFAKQQTLYNPQMILGEPYSRKHSKGNPDECAYNKDTRVSGQITTNVSGERYPSTIIRFKNQSGRGLHPTQKPVELFEYLIKTYTNEGDLVLDNCAGSFTTAIAALNTNRKYICIEKEEKYFNIGQTRINECSKTTNKK